MDTQTIYNIRKALRANFLFEDLDDGQVSALAENVWLEEIPAKSLIVREGDEADALYVVVTGGVNVTKADGQFLAYLGPGGFFGEMALFTDNAMRSASCEATDDSTCVVVRKDVLDKFCNTHPAAGLVVFRAIIRTLAERLQTTSADLAVLMGAHVRHQSQVNRIVEDARRRGGTSGSDEE